MRRIIFCFCLLLYLLSLAWKFELLYANGFFRFYFADLLAMPLILELSRWLVLKIRNDAPKELSFAMVATSLVYTSVFFEVLLPLVNERYTQDFYDVLCYVIGSAIYYTTVKLFDRKTGKNLTFRREVRIDKQKT